MERHVQQPPLDLALLMSDNNLFVFKKLRRLPTQDKAVDELQNWAEQVQVIPIANGKLLQFTYKANATSMAVKHNMGRAYVSACVACQSSNVASFFVYKPQLLTGGAYDPTKVMLIAPLGGVLPTVDVNLDVWVF